LFGAFDALTVRALSALIPNLKSLRFLVLNWFGLIESPHWRSDLGEEWSEVFSSLPPSVVTFDVDFDNCDVSVLGGALKVLATNTTLSRVDLDNNVFYPDRFAEIPTTLKPEEREAS
jgi:hypothetical protein